MVSRLIGILPVIDLIVVLLLGSAAAAFLTRGPESRRYSWPRIKNSSDVVGNRSPSRDDNESNVLLLPVKDAASENVVADDVIVDPFVDPSRLHDAITRSSQENAEPCSEVVAGNSLAIQDEFLARSGSDKEDVAAFVAPPPPLPPLLTTKTATPASSAAGMGRAPFRPFHGRPLLGDELRRRFSLIESLVTTATAVAVMLSAFLSMWVRHVPGFRRGSRFECVLAPRSFSYRTKTGHRLDVRSRIPTMNRSRIITVI